MRDVLFTFIILAFVVGFTNCIVAFNMVRRLAESGKGIDSWEDFLNVRHVITWQMYTRLIEGGTILFMAVCFGIGMAFESFTQQDIPVVASFVGVIVGLWLYKRKYDRTVGRLPVAHKLDLDFQHVMRIWHRRALPDW